MKLLLWDIDGTILNTDGLGREAINSALSYLFSRKAEFPAIAMAGRTDKQILQEYLESENLPQKHLNNYLRKLRRRYAAELRKNLNNGLHSSRPYLYKNIHDVLLRYHQNPVYANALLTGNFRKTARYKLDHFDLWKYFDTGAFGDDSHIRENLVPIAIKRASRKWKTSFQPSEVYVIGDTPRDIQICKPWHINSIAVATGLFTLEELQSENPDFLIPDLDHFPEI